MVIDEKYIPILNELLYELSEEFLEVCLVPAPYGGEYKMIRATTNRNPQWYRDLCARYPCTRTKRRSKRKDYTKIKRNYTISVLERMIKNKKSRSIYAEDIMEIVEDRLDLYKNLKEEFEFKPWDNQF